GRRLLDDAPAVGGAERELAALGPAAPAGVDLALPSRREEDSRGPRVLRARGGGGSPREQARGPPGGSDARRGRRPELRARPGPLLRVRWHLAVAVQAGRCPPSPILGPGPPLGDRRPPPG